MSEYKRLSHSLWQCTYHVVFCPKYRYQILKGKTEVFVRNQVYKLCSQKDGVAVEEINIQPDHVHLIISIPPKYSVSEMMGYLKGKLALKLFDEQERLTRTYWNKHIWTRGYCVRTIGMDEEKVKKYVKWQQGQEQKG